MLGTYLALLAVAIGFGVALAAMGSAYGLGKATAAALEATGRQPEAAGNIRTSLIIGGALIEALTIYALLVSILLWTKLPTIRSTPTEKVEESGTIVIDKWPK